MLQQYGDTYLAGGAIRSKFTLLLCSLNKPKEALDWAKATMPKYDAALIPPERVWLALFQYDAYKQLGDPASGLAELEKGYRYPDALELGGVHQDRYVPALFVWPRAASGRPSGGQGVLRLLQVR